MPGHDGTMVPLSIIHRKDLKLDGSQQRHPRRLRRLRHQLHAVLHRAAFGRAPRRGARLRASARRQREGRGLVQGRLQDHQAEHLEGLHLLRRVSRQEGLYQPGASSPAPARAPAVSSSAARSPSGRICSPRRSCNVGVRERHARGVLAQRAGQHAGVRHREGSRPSARRCPRWTACRTSARA